MVKLNFKCKKCKKVFDFDVGKITFGTRLSFENNLSCKSCGILKLDDLEMTEKGQTQVTELYFKEIK
ncbi:TPA: hypothetical protein HA235_07645 [Candidatus Woesearchaeota archaeon]|nr:hypothetical protein [Candidatus Woesearchaeota archaeon]HIH32552.1 hypothetical protein [Candidatus Woesearchaeota archaeon]HIJ02081.1 hypothetical protein [Candidatus Woesearchaeota archaeon]